MTVLLVDDEAPARQLLREYLAAYPQLAIVGEATNGIEAARLIGELRPDLVFLDVKMPGLTGLEIVRHLAELPQVIFATAYDEYAIEAFELSAVDYLLKPFTRERLARAVDNVLARPDDHLAQLRTLTDRLLGQAPAASPLRKVLVTAGRRIVTIDPSNILRLEADGDYARIVTPEDTRLRAARWLTCARDSIPNGSYASTAVAPSTLSISSRSVAMEVRTTCRWSTAIPYA